MGRFQNFAMWRGRLPHWRADGETYYVTFRARRDLTDDERQMVLVRMMREHGRRLDLALLWVGERDTEMLFQVQDGDNGEPYEFSDGIERAKRKVAKEIMKRSEERWPVFSGESYDRIVRDEAELEETFERILGQGIDENGEESFALFVPGGAP